MKTVMLVFVLPMRHIEIRKAILIDVNKGAVAGTEYILLDYTNVTWNTLRFLNINSKTWRLVT